MTSDREQTPAGRGGTSVLWLVAAFAVAGFVYLLIVAPELWTHKP